MSRNPTTISLAVVPNNEAATVCGPCGGQCCKSNPGSCLPSDFGRVRFEIKRNLLSAIASGDYCLDYWEGDITPAAKGLQAWFVRPTIKGYEDRVIHASWGGECTFLRAGGCSKPFAQRPWACRSLVADKANGCHLHFQKPKEGENDKYWSAREWLPYNDLLEEIADAK